MEAEKTKLDTSIDLSDNSSSTSSTSTKTSTSCKCLQFFKNHWGKMLLGLLGVIVLVLLIIFFVALGISMSNVPEDNEIENIFDGFPVDYIDPESTLLRGQRLAGALMIKTISNEGAIQDPDTFLQMHDYLIQKFPLVHSAPYINRTVVNEYSLLYTVEGSANGDAMPYLLAAHMDVVPADNATWSVDPFAGLIDDEHIWGRGAIDDKARVVAIMEALEYMLSQGNRPKRTFFIAFGHDEEISGEQGAHQLAETLRSRGINELDFLVDEGLGVTRNIVPGTDRPLAIISVTEKGYMTLELTVKGTAGHSSFPPKETAIGILSEAIVRLEKNPQPDRFGLGLEAQMFKDLAPHCSFWYRMIYSNLWLFGGAIANALADVSVTNSFIRTTTAVTIIRAGVKENVVPPSATATVNLRVHSSQTTTDVLRRMADIIDDSRVVINPMEESMIEPLPLSPSGPTDVAYHLVAASLRQVLENAIVVPGMFIAITDTRWYLHLTNNVYRIFPFEMTLDDTATIHGDNERISMLNFDRCVNFYYRLLKNADVLITRI